MDPLRQSNRPLLERKRLVGLSARALQSRVTVLSAGPGFGKSTLIDQWSQSQRAVLLTLSATDSSLPTLGRRLADELRLRVPAIGSGLSIDPATRRGVASVFALVNFLSRTRAPQLTPGVHGHRPWPPGGARIC